MSKNSKQNHARGGVASSRAYEAPTAFAVNLGCRSGLLSGSAAVTIEPLTIVYDTDCWD